jgi:ATP-dependent helicase/nuclease subunit B
VKGELKNYGSLQLKDLGTVSAIQKNLVDFKRAGLPFEQLLELSESESLKKRTKLCAKLYDHGVIGKEYDRLLALEYDDPEEDLTKLDALLAKHPFFADREVFVDATAAFSVQELKILERVLEQGAPLTVALQMRQNEKRPAFERIRYCKDALCRIAFDRNVAVRDLAECVHPPLKKAKDLLYLEAALFGEEERPFKGAAEHLSLEVLFDPYEECKTIAARILKDVTENGGRFLDHGVAVRNMADYEGLLVGVFKANGIPFTVASPVKLSSRPEARALLLVLRLYTNKLRFEDVRSYLKSGYSTLDDAECFLLEDYANLWRIEGPRWVSPKPFSMNPDGHTSLKNEQTVEKLLALNSCKERFATPLRPLFEKLSGARTVKEHAAALYEYMLAVGMYEKLLEKEQAALLSGDGQSAQWFGATYREIVACLDEAVRVFGEDPLDAERFSLALSALFDAKDLGSIPGGKDRVLISDVFNLKPGSLRCLYLPGMNEGVFPATPSADGVFGQADLAALRKAGVELSKESRREILDEQYSAYAALTLPYGSLFVSCHKQNLKGQSMEPSEIFLHLKALFKEACAKDPDLLYGRSICLERALSGEQSEHTRALVALFEKESAALAGGVENAPLVSSSELLSQQVANDLYGDGPLRISKSRLETFINCPFSYTCKYLLKLREKQSASTGANEVGTIFHSVFEELIEESKREGIPFGLLSNEQIERRVNGIVSRIGRELVGEEEDESRVFTQLLRRVRNAAVVFSENLRDEFEDSAFSPAFCELQFGGGTSEKLSLPPLVSKGAVPVVINGIADRVDVCKTDEGALVRVVDYKTGKVMFKISDLEQGYNLQLLLYLRALRDCKDPALLRGLGVAPGERVIPAGVQYYLARKPAFAVDRSMERSHAREALSASIQRSGWLIDDVKMQEALGVRGAEYAKKNHEYTSLSELNDALDGLDLILSDFAGQIKAGEAGVIPGGPVEGEDGCKYCKMRPICRNFGKDCSKEDE